MHSGSTASRFLVIKLADLGDALTITPALRALRLRYPTAVIDVLTTRTGAEALDGLDSLDHLITFEKSAFDHLPPTPGAVLQALHLGVRLRRARYDRVFLLHHLFTRGGRIKYAALLAATGSPWRGGVAEGRPRFLTHVYPEAGYGVCHEADYWLGVVGLAGARNPSPRLEITVTEHERTRARQLLAELDREPARPIIALYPGAGPYSPARRWPVDHYAAVGQRLITSLGARILIVGGPTERGLGERIRLIAGSAVQNMAGCTDVKTLAAVLERCDLLIGNDGGVMHLAVAVGTPVAAIFGPSNDISWGPYGGVRWEPGRSARTVVLRADLPCAPCLYRGFLPGLRYGCPSRDCLRGVTVDAVVRAAMEVLALGRPGRLG
jgi:heptosyltransferase-3